MNNISIINASLRLHGGIDKMLTLISDEAKRLGQKWKPYA